MNRWFVQPLGEGPASRPAGEAGGAPAQQGSLLPHGHRQLWLLYTGAAVSSRVKLYKDLMSGFPDLVVHGCLRK